jgi:hypothetical protein
MATAPLLGLRRVALLGAGFAFVGIGGVGVVVPGLPSTVFFILAAACFARSNPRFEAWVLRLPKIGPAVADYRAGRGMPRRAKWVAMAMLVGFSGLSIVMVGAWWARSLIGGAALVGAVVISRQPVPPPLPAAGPSAPDASPAGAAPGRASSHV